MRILIHATSPVHHSGYASVVRAVARGLVTRGHAVACYAWNSLPGPILDWDGIPIYPGGLEPRGQDMIAAYLDESRSELLLTVCDPWILTPEQWQGGHDRPVVHWYPCHSEPADPRLAYVVMKARLGLNYSRWGQATMAAAGVTNSRYVPLGVDLGTYHPMDRRECRRAILTPELHDRFLVGCVAANASTCPFGRKGFDILAQAFAAFHQRVPESALYLHTLPGKEQGGYELVPLFESLDLLPGRDVFFADRKLAVTHSYGDAFLAQLYNACDVMAQASLAEGFGLPILEAQACGTPVVTHAFSSMPEITAHGRAVPSCVRLWSPGSIAGWVQVPDVSPLADALADAHAGAFASVREAGLDLARSLSWDRVIDDHLLPALGEALS